LSLSALVVTQPFTDVENEVEVVLESVSYELFAAAK
jgi:hypothetical protein